MKTHTAKSDTSSAGNIFSNSRVWFLLLFLSVVMVGWASTGTPEAPGLAAASIAASGPATAAVSPAPTTMRPAIPLPFCPGVGFRPSGAAIAGAAPAMIIENVGQFTSDVQFQVWPGGGWLLWLAADGLTFTVQPPFPQKPAAKMAESFPISFIGANPHPRLEPFNRLQTKASYFAGSDPNQWHADVPVWGGVRYVDLYPGIDLEITATAVQWQPRLIIHEGASLAAVRLRVGEGEELSLDGNYLSLSADAGTFYLPLLQVVTAAGKPLSSLPQPTITATEVSAPFAASTGADRGEMALSGTPTNNTVNLSYATYLGVLTLDGGRIAVGADGATYVTGITYPYVDGPDQGPCAVGDLEDDDIPCHDVFIAKLDPQGRGLDYIGSISGSGDDGAEDIVVDDTGAIYLTGWTTSSDFPVTPNALATEHGDGEIDSFVAKINAAGDALLYSTYLPAGVEEASFALAVDSGGAAHVTGWFDAGDSGVDAMVVKLDASGSELLYGVVLGGGRNDEGNSIAVDGRGAAYVTGYTESADFPTSRGALQERYGDGDFDGFITKLDAGGEIAYATYLPAVGDESGRGIAVDREGAAFVTGVARSDAFVIKVDPEGRDLMYEHYGLGGSDYDQANDIAIDAGGAAFITGVTLSEDFPTTPTALQPDKPPYGEDPRDSFVARLDAGGALAYATYLGGMELDYGTAIGIDASGAAYVTGFTNSASVLEVGDGGFPTTEGAFRQMYQPGCQDPFVACFLLDELAGRLFLPMVIGR